MPTRKAKPGLVVHTAGWPMTDAFGGGFLYHLADNKVTLGFVIGLDYANPYLSPFEEMQRWKTHPAIRAHIEGGKRIGYGARAINNGTPQALPKTVFPGGALVGCDAGYLNAARIKGSHAAIKSGMLCAQALHDALAAGRSHDELSAYPAAFEASWLNDELQQSRNFKAWFKKGKLHRPVDDRHRALAAAQARRREPAMDLAHAPRPTTSACKPAAQCQKIDYPKPDGKLTFDRLSVGVHQQHQPRRKPARAPDAEGCVGAGERSTSRPTPAPRAATARPASTSSWRPRAAASACRSTRRTACTARPATSRTRRRTSSGSRPKAAAGRTTRGCSAAGFTRPRRIARWPRPAARERLGRRAIGDTACPSDRAARARPSRAG